MWCGSLCASSIHISNVVVSTPRVSPQGRVEAFVTERHPDQRVDLSSAVQARVLLEGPGR